MKKSFTIGRVFISFTLVWGDVCGLFFAQKSRFWILPSSFHDCSQVVRLGKSSLTTRHVELLNVAR